jgi:hypothetical protein
MAQTYNPNNAPLITGGDSLLPVNPTSTPQTMQPVIQPVSATPQPVITPAPTSATPIVQTSNIAQDNKTQTQSFLDWAKTNLSGQSLNAATVLANEQSTQAQKDEALRKAKLEQQKADNETKKTNALTGSTTPETKTEKTTQDVIDEENDDALNDFQNAIDQMQNGTFPLNPLQQAQLDAMRAQFEALIDAQKEANKQYEGVIQQAGITSGRSRYAPEIMAGEVLNSVNVGIKKVAELDSKMTGSLAEMESGFQNDNYKLIESSYNAFTDAQKQKQDNLNEINKSISEALKATNDANAKAKSELEKTRTEVLMKAKEGGAPTSIIQAITDAEDVANIVNSASEYLQGTSGIVGEYNFYRRQAIEQGQNPVDFNTYQTIDANRKAKATAAANASGYTPTVLNKITSKGDQFKNEAAVKRYQIVAEGQAFMDGIDNNTTNPADQQGIIYAFAKIMDPESVVREGEYNTIQKYAQSWADTFGFKASRIFSNTPFLTSDAIKNMKATINSKVSSSEKAYKNIYGEYVRQINNITGGTDGSDFLTDYSKGFTSTDILKNESAAETKMTSFGDENEIERARILQMRNDGLSWIQIQDFYNQ